MYIHLKYWLTSLSIKYILRVLRKQVPFGRRFKRKKKVLSA